MMTMGADWLVRSRGLGQETALRIRLVGVQFPAEAIERRAIGADFLVIGTHVEVDMGMIKWGSCANAHEFLGTDVNNGCALIVVEMRDGAGSHDSSFEMQFRFSRERPETEGVWLIACVLCESPAFATPLA
jgi:hypothetical protein